MAGRHLGMSWYHQHLTDVKSAQAKRGLGLDTFKGGSLHKFSLCSSNEKEEAAY